VLNSGLSLALPRVTLPYLPNAMYKTKQKIANPKNRTTFIGVVIVLLLAVIPMMVFPKASETIITDINSVSQS
jgi:hypothetical protein